MEGAAWRRMDEASLSHDTRVQHKPKYWTPLVEAGKSLINNVSHFCFMTMLLHSWRCHPFHLSRPSFLLAQKK